MAILFQNGGGEDSVYDDMGTEALDDQMLEGTEGGPVDDGIQLQSALQSSFTKAGQECAFLLIQILVSLQHTTKCHMNNILS